MLQMIITRRLKKWRGGHNMTNKTKDYTLRAVKKYDAKVKKPQVVLNPDIESERLIIEAVAVNGDKFSELCKTLLKQYYCIKV